MRKIIVLLILSAVLVFSLGAQNFNYISLANDFSAGLFPSPLDQAITVFDDGYGPGFGELPHSYLLGGIANLGDDQAGSTTATTFTNADPVFFGVYRQGDMPWSFVTGLEFTTITGEAKDTTTETYGPTTSVTVGTVTTDYDLLNQKVTTENDSRGFASFDAQAQFLTVFSGIKTGLYLNLAVTDDAAGVDNYTSTDINYYDSSTTPGTDIPISTEDYRLITTATEKASTSGTVTDLTLAVPFSMDSSGMVHSGNLVYNLDKTDRSNSLKEEIRLGADNQSAVGSATYQNNTTTDITSTHTIGADYRMVRESFLSAHPESRFTATGGVELVLTGGKSEVSLINHDYSAPGAGGALVTEVRDEDITTDTIKSTFGFGISATAAETIYHDFSPAILFGIEPTVGLGFTRSYTSGSLTKSVQVIKTDADADGAFTSATDTIQTITTTYSDANAAGGNLSYVNTMSLDFSLPASLKFQPEGWICGFILSSNPQFSYSHDTNVTLGREEVETDTTVNGDGTGETSTVTTTRGNSSSTADGNWGLTNTTSIGAEFYLPGDILLLVDINGNLWEPEGFTIQAVVPTDFLFKK